MEFHFPYIKNTKLNFRTNLTLVTPQLMISSLCLTLHGIFQQVTTCLFISFALLSCLQKDHVFKNSTDGEV